MEQLSLAHSQPPSKLMKDLLLVFFGRKFEHVFASIVKFWDI